MRSSSRAPSAFGLMPPFPLCGGELAESGRIARRLSAGCEGSPFAVVLWGHVTVDEARRSGSRARGAVGLFLVSRDWRNRLQKCNGFTWDSLL